MYETISSPRTEQIRKCHLPVLLVSLGDLQGQEGAGRVPRLLYRAAVVSAPGSTLWERSRGGHEFSDSLSRAEKQDKGQDESHWPPGFALPRGLSLWKGQVSVAQKS